MKILRIVFCCTLIVLILATGCRRARERRQQRRAERAQATQVQTEKNVAESPLPTETPHTENVAEPEGGLLSRENTVPVQPILDGMIEAYKNARTYRDKGEICISWTQNGKKWERHVPYSTNLERPNRIHLCVNDTIVNADGTHFQAYIPEFPGQILHKECPAELKLADILSELQIYLKIIDVESNRFSYLPAPLVLLLGEKPLDTFLYDVEPSRISLLEPGQIDEFPCHRVSAKRDDGETIFWIDEQTRILRRVELPTQILRQELSTEGAEIRDMVLMLDFAEAELNCQSGSVTTTVTLPADVKEVESFLPPQMEPLGKSLPEWTFQTLDGRNVAPKDVAGKNLVLLFWSIYAEPQNAPLHTITMLYRKYGKNPDFRFFAVNTDGASVTNEAVSAALAKLGIPFATLRNTDPNQQIFRTPDLVSAYLVDKKGIVQSNLALDREFEEHLQVLLSDLNVFPQVIQAEQRRQREYTRGIVSWLDNGVFLDPEMMKPRSIPDETVSPQTTPIAFRAEELWKNSELKSPGAILTLPGMSPDASERIFVLENGSTVTELDADGKILVRHDLGLPAENFETNFLSASNPADGKRFFVTFDKRVHVFGEDWKLAAHYPPKELKDLPHTVTDVVLDDLDGDGTLELYIASWNETGILKVALDGTVLARTSGAGTESGITYLQMTPVHHDGKTLLLAVNQDGQLTLFQPDTLAELPAFAQPARTFAWITACDFKGDGSESLAAIAIALGSENKAVGLDLTGKELWSIDLPKGHYRAIDRIFPVRLKEPTETTGQWLLVGADFSLHIVESDGFFIDQFGIGQTITGISSGNTHGQPVLFLSTPEDVRAVGIQW